jgi:hypothetical protein
LVLSIESSENFGTLFLEKEDMGADLQFFNVKEEVSSFVLNSIFNTFEGNAAPLYPITDAYEITFKVIETLAYEARAILEVVMASKEAAEGNILF